jgi:MFS family permease
LDSPSITDHAAVPGALQPALSSPTASRYLLAALTLFYTSSFVDRAILNILAQPIKDDLGLTDAELGILGGFAFAVLYAGLGIPIARLAERFSRVTIIAMALTLWSAMTMACGAASSFIQLAIARAGVGIGEAACTPCAHSLIGDSFPADKRATALSVYSLGIPIGILTGTLGGAWVAETYGWRAAFVAVGAPGLLLALLARLTIREPERGRFDPPTAAVPPPLTHVIRYLLARRTFNHMAIGVSISTLVSAGMVAFMAPFLLRGPYGLDLSDVAWVIAGLSGGAALIGTYAGGALCDRLATRDARLYLQLPAIAYFIAGPVYAVALMQNNLVALISLCVVAQICALIYLGPTFGVLHNMVEARMRATAIAIVFVLTSLIGLGLGPVLVGWISDTTAASGVGATQWAQCPIVPSDACRAASFAGVRSGLIVAALLYLWAGVHYYLASKTLPQDLNGPASSQHS